MSRSLDFLYDDCAGRKLFGRNRQLAGPPQYAMPLCRSVLVLSPIGSISLSYNAIKCNIIDKMLRLFQTPQRGTMTVLEQTAPVRSQKSILDFLFGRPLSSEEDRVERIGPVAGVPVFGLDALSSAASGPDEALTLAF